MKTSISFWIAILIATHCWSQNFFSISIIVIEDNTGEGINGAQVFIQEAGWINKTTDEKGRVNFDKSMPVGEIHYIVIKNGYQKNEGTFNITTEEKSNSLTIKLSKSRNNTILVTGKISDAKGLDLIGAKIEVRIADQLKIVMSDSFGNYSLEIPQSIKYPTNSMRIEAKKGEYKQVETVDIPQTNVVYKDFTLGSKPVAEPVQIDSDPLGIVGHWNYIVQPLKNDKLMKEDLMSKTFIEYYDEIRGRVEIFPLTESEPCYKMDGQRDAAYVAGKIQQGTKQPLKFEEITYTKDFYAPKKYSFKFGVSIGYPSENNTQGYVRILEIKKGNDNKAKSMEGIITYLYKIKDVKESQVWRDVKIEFTRP